MSDIPTHEDAAELTPADELDVIDAVKLMRSALAHFELHWRMVGVAGKRATEPDYQRGRRDLQGAIERLEPIAEGRDG